MAPDEKTYLEVLITSDACYNANQNRDNEKLHNLIVEASLSEILPYLFQHWVELWWEGRHSEDRPCSHSSHTDPATLPAGSGVAMALELLSSPDSDTLVRRIASHCDLNSGEDTGRLLSVSVALLTALQLTLPHDTLPSQHVIIGSHIRTAARQLEGEDLAPLLRDVTREMWRDPLAALAAIEGESVALGRRDLRRAAAILARALALHLAPGEPFTIVVRGDGLGDPGYVVSSNDAVDPQADPGQRLVTVAARMIGLAANGRQHDIDSELRDREYVREHVEACSLVLTLAMWLGDRARRARITPSGGDVQHALSRL